VDRATYMVQMDRHLVRDLVSKAPSSFTRHARNPERNVTMGDNWINFAPVAGPPNVSDLEGGRRPGTFQDQCNLIKLHQCLNELHLAGAAPVEAIDLPAESRHLDLYRAQIQFTDRVWSGRAIGRTRIEDALEMVALARGQPRADLVNEPSLLTVINVNSPRRVDSELLAGLMAMAE
jgi:trimethylamine---corrinoid protein Co-methyltransferase